MTTSTTIPDSGYFNPSQQTFSQLAQAIRSQSRSFTNRLKSIHSDSLFALSASKTLSLPVYTNSRAGDWYFNPKWGEYSGKCYFKSTDGHYANYGFSRRRLGLGVLGKLRDVRSILVIDSTRRGKRFPDSFTKTIPTWIAVFNAYYFPNHPLPFIPHPSVPPQESHRIVELVPQFLDSLRGLGICAELEKYRPPKPLRAIWANRHTNFDALKEGLESESSEWSTLVLLMVSEVVSGDGIEGEYIQGAGDDAEHWTEKSGLSPDIFWEKNAEIMAACQDGEEDQLLGLLQNFNIKATAGSSDAPQKIHPDIELYKSTALPTASLDQFSTVINCSECLSENLGQKDRAKVYEFPIESGKKGAKQLRTTLPKLKEFLIESERWKKPILLLAPKEDGDGTASAVIVYILACFFDDEAKPRTEIQLDKSNVNKATIAKRVAWVMLNEEASISRANLISVNSALMTWV